MRVSSFLFLVIVVLLLFGVITPLSTGSRIITPGASVDIGEKDLDIRSAVGNSNNLGWWIPGASIDSTPPAKTISIVGRQVSFEINSAEFAGFPGPWYALDPDTGKVRTPPVFIIADKAPLPKADFIASSTSGSPPLTVLFTDLSAGSPYKWYWHFGDNDSGGDNIAYVQNPYHIYKKPGTYMVTLTIWNAQRSTTVQKIDYINVSYAAPTVTASTEGDRIFLKWNNISDQKLKGYYVVISKKNTSPHYPENGYLLWITNTTINSTIIDGHMKYTGGDFGEYVLPGIRYYASITAVYTDEVVPGNAIPVKYPADDKILKNQSVIVAPSQTMTVPASAFVEEYPTQSLMQLIEIQNKKIADQNEQIDELRWQIEVQNRKLTEYDNFFSQFFKDINNLLTK
jgi:PKD repeat protein